MLYIICAPLSLEHDLEEGQGNVIAMGTKKPEEKFGEPKKRLSRFENKKYPQIRIGSAATTH